MRFAPILGLCVLTLCCALPGSASAVPVTWTLEGVTFQDEGTASGSFTYDADTNTYSDVNITTTTGLLFTGATYAFVCAPPCTNDGPTSGVVLFLTADPASDQTGLPGLGFLFGLPLTAPAGTIPLIVAAEGLCSNATCDVLELVRLASGAVTRLTAPIPTLSEWGMILLVVSFLAAGTWQLAGRPALLHVATVGGVVLRAPSRRLWTFILIGQVAASLGLGLYGWLVKPVAPQDVIGALLAGAILGVLLECHRQDHER